MHHPYDEASEKVLEVEQRYNRVRRPIYDKRNDVISTVKDFWPTAFLNHPTLSQLFTEVGRCKLDPA